MIIDFYIDRYAINLLPYVCVSLEDGELAICFGWLNFVCYIGGE
jgi:hypothetical protein